MTRSTLTRAAVAALGAGALAAAAATATPAPPPPAEDFVLYCSGCHGPRGDGTPDVVPSLSGLAPFLRSGTGRAYLVRVPGVAQAPIADARLAALLNWVLTELSDAPPDPAYDGDEIGALRRLPLRDPGALRALALREAGR